MSPMNPAEIYDSYFVPAMFLPSTMELVALANPVTGDRVLDIAGGSGIVVRTLAPIVGASNVVGVDLSPAMLAVARATSPELDLREGSALALPVPDAAFDLVTCQHGLQFMPDRALRRRRCAVRSRRTDAPSSRAGRGSIGCRCGRRCSRRRQSTSGCRSRGSRCRSPHRGTTFTRWEPA